MKKKFSLITCIILSVSSVFANGGIHWWENATGTPPAKITLKNDSEITLQKEDLSLRFINDEVIVLCDYTLLNKSSATKEIDFAFNVTNATHNDVEYYDIYINGNKIESELHTDILNEDEFSNIYNIWELSKLKLEANKATNVSITYRIKTENNGTYYGNKFTDNSFLYNLYPALSFGNGIIDEFNLTLDITDILGHNGQITNIEGIDISFEENKKNIISKHYTNFDLNKYKELKISYNIKNWYFTNVLCKEYQRYPVIKTTSELTEGRTIYSAENLRDRNYSTPWVEGKSDFDKNEKIIIETKGLLTQLVLVNGFRKSSKTYYENNRIKRIAVYVDGERLGEMEFPDRPYKAINSYNLLDEGELINLGNFFEKYSKNTWDKVRAFYPSSNIELEILDVYKGTKYNDTCVSEIITVYAHIPTA